MKDFTLHIPTRLFFGPDQQAAFIKALSELGRRCYLITGGGSVKRLGYLEEITGAMAAAGFEIEHFSGIEPNPLAGTINRAAAEAKGKNIDFVLAFGGGSVMDAAKAIAGLIHDNETDIWEFVTGSPRFGTLTGALPIAAIPTTAATASEVTAYSVISNLDVKGKSSLGYEFFKPRVSFLNPRFTTKLPPHVTQDGAADILSHVFENYFLGGSDSPVADRLVEGIVTTVLETLPELLRDLENEHYRGVLQWSATLALSGLQRVGRNPSQYVLHSIEHAMSAQRHELSHGRGLATLYPAYFRWLLKKGRCRDRMAQLARAVFGETGADADRRFIELFENWLRENDLLQSAEDLGLSSDVFPEIAGYAVSIYGDGEVLDAQGPMTKDDIVEILEMTRAQSVRADK